MDGDIAFNEFMLKHIAESRGDRKARLLKGLGHGETDFLKNIWYPAVGNFDHVFPEWEIRDYKDGVRYLDIAYMPGVVKGVVEVQGYGPHARDIPRWRFKDESLRHCHLVLDGWTVLPIAYDLVRDNPRLCQQLVLSFIGKFVSQQPVPDDLNWLGSEVVRFARRVLRPITPQEVSAHLKVSPNYARKLLHHLVDKGILKVASGQARIRTYILVY
ncbi:transcriptional regulator [Paenibacillus thermotolerans]|uniref:transcriptional regulator n=1 Tax=Paenibacillus thermotolerans TaxID=3027807 RepID=UPI00236775B3|nr:MULTISPECIES: transcriptional regulator [unclassified Paenibacillus]